MLTLSAFETAVLSVLQRVTSGAGLEDSRVECKRHWPEPADAARAIAGHANSLHGEPITWLIGVDEKAHTAPGVPAHELSNWLSQFRSRFDGIPPDLLYSLNVPFESTSVAALLFLTDRAPYVVKNAQGGPIQLEVPWREGTAVRSARRSDLLLLLSPLRSLPALELLDVRLCYLNPKTSPSWHLDLLLYLEPVGRDPLVIPFHRCSAHFHVADLVPRTSFTDLHFSLPPEAKGHRTDTEVVLEHPGLLTVGASVSLRVDEELLLRSTSASVSLSLRPVGAATPLVHVISLAKPTEVEAKCIPTFTLAAPCEA